MRLKRTRHVVSDIDAARESDDQRISLVKIVIRYSIRHKDKSILVA